MTLNNLGGYYITEKFTDIFPSFDEFKEEYTLSALPQTMTESGLSTLYYLLYAKYGNSSIASSDINQFKYQLFALIFTHGANWERRISLQETLRDLPEEELIASSKQIINHALNPSTAPSTSSLSELTYINQQTTSGYRKNKIDAYMLLYSVLSDEITERFLNKFKKLFISIVMPQIPLWYVSETED
jgi:hypothetical protein